MVTLAASVVVLSLAACGSATSSRRTTKQALASAGAPGVALAKSSASAAAGAGMAARPARAPHHSRLELAVEQAKRTYAKETRGSKVHSELARIARDGALLNALRRGDTASAQAEADAQLHIPLNHTAHVTRIGVNRGTGVLVNATVNADGVFVVAPATRALNSNGRHLGTLLVSVQDITGFVKLVHDVTGADVLVRGSSGRLRTSLGAAAGVRLPRSGTAAIAGRRYLVQSFGEIGWGNEASAHEPLTVWVLERA